MHRRRGRGGRLVPGPETKSKAACDGVNNRAHAAAVRCDRPYLAVDFFRRHRFDPCLGRTLGDRQKRLGRVLPPDRIPEPPVECLRCQWPGLTCRA